MGFKFKQLSIKEVILIEPDVFGDERGFFLESYKQSVFLKEGIGPFVQDNHSRSIKGVLRGLHYQKHPHAQGKLVRCIRGKIFDVAVDIRKGSPTYSKWVGEILSEENKKMLYIPEGFAHGFLVLSDIAELMYKTTKEYAPQSEGGIIWNEPTININWGIDNPILSKKDAALPSLENADNNFIYEEAQ